MFPTDAARSGLPAIERRGRTFRPRQLHLTGWRWLMAYQGTGVNELDDSLWGDVPANHGLYTPLVFDPRTDETLGDTSLEWWAANLPTLCRESQREDAPLTVETLRPGAARVIFLNTLDYVFGHSLLLLLNAGYYLDRFPDHGLIVILSPELRRFVPEGVAEVWTLHVPPAETRQWHGNLDLRFARRVAEAEDAFVASALPLPAPERYDLRRHGLAPATPPAPKGRDDAPTILFTYRGSRLWGGSWSSERRRLAGLARWLRKLWPAVRLEIVGHAPLPTPVPGWADGTRRGAGSEDYDAGLLTRFASADLVLGAHGSNMLLPTAVAPRVVELVPLDKYASLLQDTLLDARRPLRENLWRRRYLHGNGTMNDLSPRSVALLIHAMISMDPYFEVLQGGNDGLDDPAARLPIERAERFRQVVTPATLAWRERERRLLEGLPWTTRFWQWLRRQGAERD